MANIDEYGEIIEKDNDYVRKPGKNKTKFVIFFLIWLIVLGLYLFSNKQIFNQNIAITWEKTFGGNDDDFAYSIIQTTDGGYAVAGTTESYDIRGGDFWIIKLDSRGNKLWDKTFGGRRSDRAYSIIQTTNGGYVVAGYTRSYSTSLYDFWVIKLDSWGNKVWDKTFSKNYWDMAYSIIQTTDGGYAVVGETKFKDNSGGKDIWVIKLDKKGNLK